MKHFDDRTEPKLGITIDEYGYTITVNGAGYGQLKRLVEELEFWQRDYLATPEAGLSFSEKDGQKLTVYLRIDELPIALAPCYACGQVGVDRCPLCGRCVCRVCRDKEGEFCCDSEVARAKR